MDDAYMQHAPFRTGAAKKPQLVENRIERLMTYRELAAYLNMTERTLRRHVAAKKIPFAKIGRSVRFDKSKIEAWLHKKGA